MSIRGELRVQDIIGREVAVGDIVAFKLPGGGRDLDLGTIIKIAKKTLRVEYHYKNSWTGQMQSNTTLVNPSNVVKLEGPDLTLHLLKKSG
jgi:hypothetical protein